MVKNIVAENVSESYVELSFAGKNAQEQFEVSTNSVFMVYNTPFKRLL